MGIYWASPAGEKVTIEMAGFRTLLGVYAVFAALKRIAQGHHEAKDRMCNIFLVANRYISKVRYFSPFAFYSNRNRNPDI